MLKRQNAFLKMNSAVKATCDAHEASWSGFSSFTDPYVEFLNRFGQVNAAIALQAKLSKGTTEAKNALRAELNQSIFQLGIKLYQYGKDTANSQMAEDAYLSKSKIEKLSEKAVVGHAIKIQGLVPTPIPVVLSNFPYGITAAYMSDFQSIITNFSLVQGSPKHIRAEKKEGTQALAELIAQQRTLLESMDSAAEVLQFLHPIFYSEYKSCREITDAGATPRDLTVLVSDSASLQPIAGATATFAPGGLIKNTAAQGLFYVQKMKAGKYVLTIAKVNYASQDVPFEVDKNGGVKLNVQLVKS